MFQKSTRIVFKNNNYRDKLKFYDVYVFVEYFMMFQKSIVFKNNN
jgi:hypothetical protein